MPNPLPSLDYLRTHLDYDPESGDLTWAYGRGGVSKGKRAGHLNKKQGMWQVMLERRSYLAHRLIWKLMTGEDPPSLIDHINHDPSDNRWENLRAATSGQNNQNKRGWGKLLKGVSKSTCGVTYEAKINVDGVKYHLGCFQTEEEAHQAYCRASAKLHGEFGCIEKALDLERRRG